MSEVYSYPRASDICHGSVLPCGSMVVVLPCCACIRTLRSHEISGTFPCSGLPWLAYLPYHTLVRYCSSKPHFATLILNTTRLPSTLQSQAQQSWQSRYYPYCLLAYSVLWVFLLNMIRRLWGHGQRSQTRSSRGRCVCPLVATESPSRIRRGLY